MRSRLPVAAQVLSLMVTVAVLVACGADRPTRTGESVTPTAAASPTDFLIPPANPPAPWSSLTPGPLVRKPFSGPGNQYVMALTAYGDGFVAVGEDFQSDQKVDGAIWASSNGQDWKRLDTSANGLTAAVVDYVAAGGQRLVAVGHARVGGDSGSGRDGIVWTSDDGASWQRVDNPAPFGSAQIGGMTAGPSSFVVWGVEAGNAVTFHSTDGIAWKNVTDAALFAGMSIGEAQPYRGGFVAVGANLRAGQAAQVGGPNRSAAAAWWSADGLSWQAASTGEGFGLSSLEVGAAGLLALGSGACAGCVGPAVMWRSGDGRTWTHVGDDVPNWPNYVSDGARIVRYDWQGSGDVFDSVDGKTWQKIGTTGRSSMYGLALGPHGILVVDSISPGAGGAGDENDGAVRFLATR